ncbi:MAG: hypothetical protein CM15mP46_3370 [Alphaproteobacteria bacterium]|nr:MAG: hypothetical protein CM15mP46_3370 [Alphaproteobacteria bacterium]
MLVLIVYADAFEWVELPNVSGMVLFADGGYLARNPMRRGAYINRMSNYCRDVTIKSVRKTARRPARSIIFIGIFDRTFPNCKIMRGGMMYPVLTGWMEKNFRLSLMTQTSSCRAPERDHRLTGFRKRRMGMKDNADKIRGV